MVSCISRPFWKLSTLKGKNYHARCFLYFVLLVSQLIFMLCVSCLALWVPCWGKGNWLLCFSYLWFVACVLFCGFKCDFSHYLFLISPTFGASARMFFMIQAFPRYILCTASPSQYTLHLDVSHYENTPIEIYRTFHLKKTWKFSDKNLWYFSYFCSKYRL